MDITSATLLEVTITHNLTDPLEVKELYSRQWIALDWDRKGPEPSEYAGRAKTDVLLFRRMQGEGAAVIAAYKPATRDNPAKRLIGAVKQGTRFTRLNGLLCLPLVSVQEVDSSRSFLGNLAPRQCTVQTCGNRAKGRLADLVMGTVSPNTIALLHHHDVEWLVTNYLIVTGLCKCVWSGGRSFEDIDHAGAMPDGRELLAQTTISSGLIRKKGDKLLKYTGADRALYMFGPEDSLSHCPDGITYIPIERLMPRLMEEPAGQWLVKRMLNAIGKATITKP